MSNEFRLPDIGEGLTDAEIVEWFVAVGDGVEADQPIVEVETAKTTVEITAMHTGTVLYLGGSPGDTINVGEVLFVVGDRGEVYAAGSRDQTPSAIGHRPSEDEPAGRSPSAGRARAMPVARRLARELGVDLSTVTGSGPNGAITRADVEAVSNAGPSKELTPLSRVRKRIARHMTESWTTIPHVTVQADIRAENLLEARQGRAFKAFPIESLVAIAVLPLLRRYPEFNAAIHDDAIAYRDHYNLGFAVDTDSGLLVVVVRDADGLSLAELAVEFERLSGAAADGTLTPDEVTGQTFTISNIGALGGGHGTPIIPLGTSAILSIGRASEAPVVENGGLGVGIVAPIDLSYDHRLIDGGLGQRFLSDLVDAIENLNGR